MVNLSTRYYASILIVFIMPLIAYSQNDSKEEQLLERGRSYSDSILQKLRDDLLYLRSSDELIYPLDWNRTLNYVKDRLVDTEFGETYSCEISKWMIGDYFVKIIWNPIEYDPSNFDWVPVYVFLPCNEYKQATFASFREMTEKSFANLPTELSDFYRTLNVAIPRDIQRLRFDDTLISISGDSLKSLLPSISSTEYFLANLQEVKKANIKRVEFYFAAIGPDEIRAEFYSTLEGAVFAFPKRDSASPPRFVQFDSSLYKSLLNDTTNISVIPTPKQGPVYIGTICSVPVSINILWDPKDKIINQLMAMFGVSLGNEMPCYRHNYLLSYGGEYFVLRVSDRCADLIFMKPHDFRIETIADETAPEM